MARHRKAQRRKVHSRKPKERIVTICPKCGSTDVHHDWSNPGVVAYGLSNVIYKCNHCGHSGPMFPEGPKSKAPKSPKNLKDVKDRNLVDNTLGRGEVGMLKITGPPIILFTLIMIFLGDPTARILSLLIMLPLSIFYTSLGYFSERIAKSEFLKTFCIMMLIYEAVISFILYVRIFA